MDIQEVNIHILLLTHYYPTYRRLRPLRFGCSALRAGVVVNGALLAGVGIEHGARSDELPIVNAIIVFDSWIAH